MHRWLKDLLNGVLCLVLVGWVALGASANETVLLQVALDVGNVHQFSARDKTYSVEGALRLSAPAAVVEGLQAAGVDPIELLRFQNQVEPWNSLMEPASGWLKLGNNLGRD